MKYSKERTTMKFSTKSRYALRLMAELARYAPGTTVSLKEISERQNLSLTKDAADYTAGEILRAIEGSVAPIPCLGSVTNECPMSEQCFTLPFWAGLDEVINQYIDSVTLEQLASQLPALDSAAQESCCSCGGTKNEK